MTPVEWVTRVQRVDLWVAQIIASLETIRDTGGCYRVRTTLPWEGAPELCPSLP